MVKELTIELDAYKRTVPKSLISEDRGVLYERPPTPEKPSGIESLAGRFRTAGTTRHNRARARARARARVRVRAWAWALARAWPTMSMFMSMY